MTSSPGDAAAGQHQHHHGLARAVRAVSGVTLVSRLWGMVREVLVVRIFGETALGSSFAAGFAIPNLFRRLFGEGALSAAFIPEYTDALKVDEAAGHSDERGAGAADRFASRVMLWLGLATGALTVLIELVLLGALLGGEHTPERATSLRLIMVMLPFMPFVCCAAILAGMLQVHGKFAASSTGPLVLNGFIIAVGLYFLLTGQTGSELTAIVLGVATVLSGATQCAWFAKILKPRVRWTRDAHDEATRARASRMGRKFVPVVIGAGALQISTLLDMMLAMWPIWVGPAMLGIAYPLDERSNILLSAAQRLYQFPLGVFGIAVATAVFPMLARTASDAGAFAETLRRGVRLSLFIGLPASAGLLLVAEDLTRVLYSGGTTGFEAAGVARSAAALALYACGIWAFSINHVFSRAFYARGETHTPMRVSLAAVGINFAMSVGLILGAKMDERALALSSTLAAAAQAVVMAVLCRNRLGVSVWSAGAGSGIARLVAAAAVMSAAVIAAQWALPTTTESWAASLLRLAISCTVGAAAYAATCRVLRAPELGWLLARTAKAAVP